VEGDAWEVRRGLGGLEEGEEGEWHWGGVA